MTRDRPRVPIRLVPALILAILLAAASPALARVPQGFVGMALGDPVFPPGDPTVDLASQVDGMVGAGVESLRVVFNGSYAQPYQSWSDVPSSQTAQFTDVGGIPTRFDQMDEIVGLAAQHRLKVLPTVLYAPSWDSAHHSSATYARPASDGPYADFVTALIHRYGPNGTFWLTHSPADPIREWQVWNEPNVFVFWPARPFQASYVALLRAAHAAIKRADPGAKIVLGGMPNYSWLSLKAIYRIPGARHQFDVVALHPYTRQPQGVITILKKVRAVMGRAGDGRKPIIADELSWPSSLGKTHHTEGFDFATTPAGQARKVARMLPILARDRRRLRLLSFYYYTWAGVEQRGGLAFDFAGLFRINGSQFVAKPAFYAFRGAALALEGCRKKGAVATVCVQRR
jgi:hypothetical protein